LVAIAGPPGSGKSTLAEWLLDRLNASTAGCCGLLPMDGYHFDNAVLEARGLMARKGAPETFDTGGLLADLRRIKAQSSDVAVPVFDRAADLARAGARIVGSAQHIVLVEGNYLLLELEDWREIAEQFDLTVLLEVDDGELEKRLVRRWLDHGLDEQSARRRAQSNDLVNARLVMTNSRAASIVVSETEL
jgi:pantothenate kinase